MNTINGVTFDEFVALSSHLSQGFTEEQIGEILQLDPPALTQTIEQWNIKLGELMAEDISYTTRFSEIFANPKVGRFAQNTNEVMTDEEVLQKVPSLAHYFDIFFNASIASQYGFDPIEIYKVYDLNVGQWAVVANYYDRYNIAKLDTEAENYQEQFHKAKELMDEFKDKWETFYSNR
ncbi:hypothetical protein [Myroides pelagicus]|uniref:Uncharacterized protein n=1 Tax=Myroides pelagicus TaxID=270914 RepID=A0A7K1GNX0_9FLAO|nr:hypothetical protein [Myroides pelagicus]MTH30595.1 hypothetical protein [Myroides pelagicus]